MCRATWAEYGDFGYPAATLYVMVAIFCLRLAFGLIACLLVLPTAQLPPRLCRVHFLTALGLTGVALTFSFNLDVPGGALSNELHWAFVAGLASAFIGSIVWHVEGAPFGRWPIIVSAASSIFALSFLRYGMRDANLQFLADNLTSAAVLGSATTAMLIGHSYLIAPGMSLTPLTRMLLVLAGSLVVRAAVAGVGLWLWTGVTPEPFADTETMLFLAVRWLLGIIAPLVLGWMAWETARIRSTQSATGILYVVVIVCFLGELTSQLLFDKTGYIL